MQKNRASIEVTLMIPRGPSSVMANAEQLDEVLMCVHGVFSPGVCCSACVSVVCLVFVPMFLVCVVGCVRV